MKLNVSRTLQSVCISSVVALLFISQAQAQGKAPPSDPSGKMAADERLRNYDPNAPKTDAKYMDHWFSNYIKDATIYADKHVQAETEKSTQAAAEAKAARARAEADEAKLREKESEIQRELARKRKEMDEVAKNIDHQANVLAKADFTEDEKQNRKKTIDSLTAKQKELQTSIDSLDNELKTPGLTSDIHNATNNLVTKGEEYMKKAHELQNKLSDKGKATLDFEAFNRGVEEMYSRMRQTGYDAQLLLTDFEVLKAKNQLNDQRLQILKNKFDNQLNKTLLGQYVNEQIKKAMLKVCELKNKCDAAGPNIKGISDVLEKALSESRSGDVMNLGSGDSGAKSAQ